ncbi:FG-GAP-like repeat-containing protein [Streptomyces sp. NPDC001816]|uniref:FG-GAP-like repeat-containing protein n=1 Tax=Streptomyces sp. NPDC001816 TaxID=3364612 RepID=UPI0036CF1357
MIRAGTPRRRRRPSPTLVTSAAVFGLVLGPATVTAHADTSAPDPATTLEQAEATASAQAAATGRPVPVDQATTIDSTLTAQPDGTFTQRVSAEPERLKRDGQWVPLDATLQRNGDGSYSPATSSSGLTLSGGGSGSLATLDNNGKRLSLSWPTALPTPTVNEDSALYPDVLPDVDLKVTADEQGGFSEVLVVKTAQAASNPRLATLTLATDTHGLDLATDPGGNLTVADPGTRVPVFHAPAPLMWDSTGTGGSAQTTRSADSASLQESSPRRAAVRTAGLIKAAKARSDDAGAPQTDLSDGPSPTSQQAPVHTDVTPDGHLRLTPDPGLLKTASFPLYIDPTWISVKGEEKGFTYVQHAYPGTSHWNDSDAKLGVGYQGYTSPTGAERTYYQFNIGTSMGDKHIHHAELDVNETYSADWGCTKYRVTETNVAHISSSTSWNNQPDAYSQSDTYDFTGANNKDCPGGDAGGFDVTSSVSNDGDGTVTYRLTGSESNETAFKRFSTKATLAITYNTPPRTPTSTTSSPKPASPATYGCGNTPYGWISNTDASGGVKLYAHVSDPDGDKQNVRGQFAFWDKGGSGTADAVNLISTGDSDGNSSTVPGSGGTAQITVDPKEHPLKDGHLYGWHVRANDGIDASGEADNCYFWYDATAPNHLAITPKDDTSDLHTGDAIHFALSATDPKPTGAAASGLDHFIWSPTSSAALDNDGGTSITAAADGTTSLTYTPTAWGSTTLWVAAVDNAGNQSQPVHFTFYVPDDVNATVEPGDIDNDHIPDLVAADSATGNLDLVPTHTDIPTANGRPAPVTASGPDDAPSAADGTTTWANTLLAHRSSNEHSSSGNRVDDLWAYKNSHLWLYTNNLNNNGGLAGNGNLYFTRDHRIAVARPDCTKGTCSAYRTDWSAVSQITAPGDVNGDGHPDLVTVESDHLWLFLGSTATGQLAEAHEIGTAAWNGYTITSPGDTNNDGHPNLWARNKNSGVIYDFPFGTDSLGIGTAITNGAFTSTDRPLMTSPGDANGDGIADLYTITGDKELWANMGTAPDANGYRLGAHHIASAGTLWKTITNIA